VLSVNATPWGRVVVNGRAIGETPLDVELPAGRYRVRILGPRSNVERTLLVRAGSREPWLVQLRAR
jgi:hypothetical protein